MKVAIGLSGGVDSSVAALLLKEQGHEVIGITMKLWHEGGRYKGGTRDSCFGPGEKEDIVRARALADSLGIKHELFDCGNAYERAVIDYFRETTLRGETPNPCVVCNAAMKFGLLPTLARAAGLSFDCFATGHYARLVERNGRFAVRRAVDLKKDQSYFLCRLSQEQLAQTLFPLGDLTKVDVRQIATAHGLAAATKLDSQDFYSGDKNELVGAAPRRGEIVDVVGRVLAHHDGFWNFTVGQRKGLGVCLPEPVYVIAVDACHNRVTVGTRAEAYTKDFTIGQINCQAVQSATGPLIAFVKVRSTGEPIGPVILENGTVRVPEGQGVFGVTPGQSAVFYDEDGVVLCAGVIQRQSHPLQKSPSTFGILQTYESI